MTLEIALKAVFCGFVGGSIFAFLRYFFTNKGDF